MAKTKSSYLCVCKCQTARRYQFEFVQKSVPNTNVSYGNCIEIELRTKVSLTKAILDGSEETFAPLPTYRKATTRERVWIALILPNDNKYSTVLKSFRAKSKGHQKSSHMKSLT